jgi:sporulation protein YlmC with PRC-barrel domain
VRGEKLVGMQVIDERGAVVGSVKDLGIDLRDNQLILYVKTKEDEDLEVFGAEIQSIEDVVLIDRESVPSRMPPAPASAATRPQTISCPLCQATLPAQAKFCAKCGRKIG